MSIHRKPRRKRLAPGLLIALAVTFALPCAAQGYSRLALAPNDPAPPLSAPNVNGIHVDVDWSEARLTVVNFWASWCRPCAREMPHLESLYQQHGPRGLAVIGVSNDDRRDGVEVVVDYLRKVEVTYPIVLGGPRLSRMWGGIAALPTTFLVDGQGKVLRRFVGGSEEMLAALTADIEAFLDGQPLGPPFYPEALPEPGS